MTTSPARRTLVTGGAGFIGSHLSECLREQGREVLVLDNFASGKSRLRFLENAGIPVEEIDIRDSSAVDLIESFRPNEIFHLAAQMDVRRSVEDPVFDADVNILGTLKVLEGARRVGARVICTSSGGCIYGEVDAGDLPLGEHAQGLPTSPYGISKKVTEDYLHFFRSTYDLPFVNLALANVYGPRQDPHGEAGVVAIFASKLINGETCSIYGDGLQTRDFVYVGDVVDAYLAASLLGEGERFNIGTSRQTNVNELFVAIAKACGVTAEPRYGPARPGELQRSALDYTKAEKILDWSPKTSLESGLKFTVEFIRQAEASR